jgi:hypothetical protein
MTIRKGMAVGKGSGYKNIIPKYDARVHSQAAKGIKQPQQISNLKPRNIKITKPKKEIIRYVELEASSDGDGTFDVIGKNNTILDTIYTEQLVEDALEKNGTEYDDIDFDGNEAHVYLDGEEVDTFYLEDMAQSYMDRNKSFKYKQVSERRADKGEDEHDSYYQ